jgi:ABC-2 type transport system permease protein
MTIARREFRSYFDSALAYVVICITFLLLGGMFFMYRGGFWQLDQASVGGVFDWIPLGLTLLVVPVVTMRLLAEERRSGTLEMLITLPVRDSDVIIGKYLGALGLILTVVFATLAYPIVMFKWPWNLGPLDWHAVLVGYLGLFLFASAAVAIGLLITALTDSQAIAGLLTVFVLATLWFLGGIAGLLPGGLAAVLQYLSFDTRLDGFSRGLIDTRDVVFFVSVTAVALMVAFRALERRKWA